MQPAGLITNDYAPPFKIVVKYFIAAGLSFFISSLLLVLIFEDFSGSHFQPKLLSITHIITLGWITMTIFGALFQLIPVVLQVKLFSETLAEIQFWIFASGVLLFVYSFWFFNTGFTLTFAASLINAAILIFLLNAIITLTKVKEWNITATYLTAALFYLFVTGAAGLLLAINLGYPYIKENHLIYIKYHLIIAVVGWVAMVIMGVTFKLIPMFTLSHKFSKTSGKWAFVLINLGLIGILIELHLRGEKLLFIISSIVIAAGIFFFLYQTYLIFKERIRKKLDTALKFTRMAYIFFGITTVFAISFLIFDFAEIFNITLAFGYLIFFGFISMLIVGQMYKILPFLTWYHKYSSKAGLEKVPMLRDMYNEKISKFEYYFMFAAVIGVPIFVLLKLQLIVLLFFILMLISAMLYIYNMIKIMVT